MCVKTYTFPSSFKRAEVSPIYKKDDVMNKNNYRPVSVLPCISKIAEGILVDQMKTYFEDKLSPYMSGLEKLHTSSCQSVLLRVIDRKDKCALLLTDLSKAFDCLPHRFNVGKTKCLWCQCQCIFSVY